MTEFLIEIDGITYQASSLALPASGREFREAWMAPVDGVIEVNVDRARELRADQIHRETVEKLDELRAEARHAEAKGRNIPGPVEVAIEKKAAARDYSKLSRAKTVEDLAKITADDTDPEPGGARP